MPERTDVVVFDVNETLSDMVPLGTRFTDVGVGAHLAQTWFACLLRDAFALTAAGASAPFAELARTTAAGLLQQAGVADVDAAVEHLLAGFAELAVHPDVPEGVRALRAAGLRLATLSNGGAHVAEGLLERAGLRQEFEHVLSVEDAGRWKPAPESYAYAARVCGAEPGRMLLVAVHPWDVDGAQRAGLRGAWVDRTGARYPSWATAPALVAPDLVALAAQLA